MVNRTLILFAALIAGTFAQTAGCEFEDLLPEDYPFTTAGGNVVSMTTNAQTFDSMFTSCGVNTPAGASWLRNSGDWIQYDFSTPVNGDVTFRITALDNGEDFTFESDQGLCLVKTISDPTCVVKTGDSTIEAVGSNGGSVITITMPDNTNWLKITQTGDMNGALFAMSGCLTTVGENPSTSPTVAPTSTTTTMAPSAMPISSMPTPMPTTTTTAMPTPLPTTTAMPTPLPTTTTMSTPHPTKTATTSIIADCLESAADCPVRCEDAFGAVYNTSILFEADVCKCTTEVTITELVASGEEIEGTTNIDLQILLDATGSMGAALSAMSQSLIEMIDNIQTEIKTQTGFDAALRVGAVAYRDPLWAEAPTDNEHIAFTTVNSEIDAFLASLAPNGGGDMPEDVNGGLRIMLDQEWTSEHKFIIHITDAGMLGENGPDPAGIMYQDLFTEINDLGITYVVGRMSPAADNMIANFNEVYSVNDAGVAVSDPTEAEIDVLNLEGMGVDELSAAFTTELVSTIVNRVQSRKVVTTLAEWDICPATTTEAPASCPSNVFVSTADCLTDELCQSICEHEDGSLCPMTACKCETVFNEYASACCGGTCHDDYEELWRANHHSSFGFTIEGVSHEWDRTIEGCTQICKETESCDAFNVVENVRCEIIAGYTYMEPGSDCETCFVKVSHSEPTTTAVGSIDTLLRRNLKSAPQLNPRKH